MRLNRGTLFLLIGSLVVIVAALLLLNSPARAPENGTVTSEAPSGPLFAETGVAQINALTIRDLSSELSLTLARAEDESWFLRDYELPPNTTVRSEDLLSAVSGIADITYSDRFQRDDLAPFGLDAPRYQIEIDGAEDGFTLRIGSKNPNGSRYYALLNDETEIYLIGGVSTIDRLVGYIGNPPLNLPPTPTPAPQLSIPGMLYLGFDSAALRSVVLEEADGARSEWLADELGNWSLPDGTLLDNNAVARTLEGLAFLRSIDGIETAELAALGLDTPRATITATRSDGRTYVLRVGNPDPTGTRIYTLVDDYETIVVVDRAEVESLIRLLAAPPLLIEETPEATAESTAEATAEAQN